MGSGLGGFFLIEQFLSAEEQSVLYGDPNEKNPKTSVAEQLTMKNNCAFHMAVYCKKQTKSNCSLRVLANFNLET